MSKARLDELVKQATVYAYDESEQRAGFIGMLQEHLVSIEERRHRIEQKRAARRLRREPTS